MSDNHLLYSYTDVSAIADSVDIAALCDFHNSCSRSEYRSVGNRSVKGFKVEEASLRRLINDVHEAARWLSQGGMNIWATALRSAAGLLSQGVPEAYGVPVFSEKFEFCGYLKNLTEWQRKDRQFQLMGYKVEQLSTFEYKATIEAADCRVQNYPCVFRWTESKIVRHDEGKVWRCKILIASEPASLPYIKNFKFFAEMHGIETELPDAASSLAAR